MIKFVGKLAELVFLSALVALVGFFTAPFWMPLFAAVVLVIFGAPVE